MPKGAPQKAGFFGHRMENFQNEVKPFWVSEINTKSSGSVDVMEKAVDYVRKLVPKPKRIGVETRVHPARFRRRAAQGVSRRRTQGCAVRAGAAARAQDAGELEKLRIASDAVIDSMQAVFTNLGPGATKARADRGVAPRGDLARADLRLLPDRGRIEPQPRAVGPALGEGRCAVARFRRQLSRLYRRRGAHGQSPASRTPNSSICWPRSRRSSRHR